MRRRSRFFNLNTRSVSQVVKCCCSIIHTRSSVRLVSATPEPLQPDTVCHVALAVATSPVVSSVRSSGMGDTPVSNSCSAFDVRMPEYDVLGAWSKLTMVERISSRPRSVATTLKSSTSPFISSIVARRPSLYSSLHAMGPDLGSILILLTSASLFTISTRRTSNLLVYGVLMIIQRLPHCLTATFLRPVPKHICLVPARRQEASCSREACAVPAPGRLSAPDGMPRAVGTRGGGV
jgi:hypothetical protein